MVRRTRYKRSLEIAKDEALRACDFYNQRRQQRNLQSFLVHMSLAWLNLFHALNERDGIDMRVRDERGRVVTVDGEPQLWDLATCVAWRLPDPHDPVRVNLEFFLRLRPKLERRLGAKAMAALDVLIAGRAQSALRNFEQLLIASFGPEQSLGGDLRFPVFLASLSPGAAESARDVRVNAPRAIVAFIDAFDAALEPAVAQSEAYEFRVVLFARNGPRSADDLPVEFLNARDLNPEQRKAMDNALVLVRDKQVPVANLERLKPGEVVRRVQAVVPAFNMTYHQYAFQKYKARPSGRAADPTGTNPAYCVYDAAHKDYVYTPAWVAKLLHELEHDPETTLAEWRREALAKRYPHAQTAAASS
jgi:hypothetical protein